MDGPLSRIRGSNFTAQEIIERCEALSGKSKSYEIYVATVCLPCRRVGNVPDIVSVFLLEFDGHPLVHRGERPNLPSTNLQVLISAAPRLRVRQPTSYVPLH